MSNFDKLEKFCEDICTDFDVPGICMAVNMDGKEVFSHVGGYADLEEKKPMDRNMLFRLYSMSKPITIVAAMTLFEKGKFLLNDPIAYYLPSFWNAKMFSKNGEVVPIDKHITVMDLMTMRSGLSYCGNSNPTECAMSDEIGKLIARTGFAYTTREFADTLSLVPVLFTPGSHWQYSYSIDVLGALVEVWSGMSLGEYMKKVIFDPLHMTHTTFHPGKEERENLVSIYEYNYETHARTKIVGENNMPLYGGTKCEHGGHGLFSTLDDYMAFAKMLANGGKGEDGQVIVSANTIDLIRTNFLGSEELKDEHTWSQLAGYGYGLGVRTMMDTAKGGSNGFVGEFGWSGLAGCYVLADPERKLSAVYMQSMTPNREPEIHPRLRNVIYGCL